MPLSIVFTSNASIDIQQAIYWENSRDNSLGERFLNSLYLKLEVLSVTPYIGSIRYENVRCTTLAIFQYLLHYTVEPDQQQIIILRVLHTRQKPTW